MIKLVYGHLYEVSSQLLRKKPQVEIDLRVEGVSQDAILQDVLHQRKIVKIDIGNM